MANTRREFIKKTSLGAAGLMVGNGLLSAASYKRIIGANDRINVAVIGLGRRLEAFVDPISNQSNNIRLRYLCDVMPSQLKNAGEVFAQKIDHKPEFEKDIRKVLEDKNVDAVFNLTPDHWHAPGSIMAMQAGKHVYVEKPCSHNMNENELIVQAAHKYNKIVQMGNQQRSSVHTINLMEEIHKGLIGEPYRAIAFYTNKRGRVPNQQAADIPGGLDWDLFQGPAIRRPYTSETWNYNWHWYGWDYGTAEAGNNGTHEMDIARWALQVEFPNRVEVNAMKGHFKDDGWEMYDSMEATFKFDNNKSIKWDGQSRNGFMTYGSGRGTIIYGSEGSVFVNRNKYIVYDRAGKIVKQFDSETKESGIGLGGGGTTSSNHAVNFFNTIRGKEKLTAPIDDASVSMSMVHYANVAYRINRGFDIDSKGKMLDKRAMELWAREYQPGWEIKL
ncbi:Gfo/Idh/MocA family protein [Saccharicrinis sp. 156]|uniref:Gfo/Idh/MocA family protein n=1 Tax=Saccharicrinis sp. 156 TaxID=3417574 RepID=UPI003D337B3E